LPHLSRERFNAWTPGYAAPELLDGQPLSASADVYGVACVIFELAGGKHPFRRFPRPRHVTSDWSANCVPPKPTETLLAGLQTALASTRQNARSLPSTA
jgi:serine/threonine-protein kinase Stk1